MFKSRSSDVDRSCIEYEQLEILRNLARRIEEIIVLLRPAKSATLSFKGFYNMPASIALNGKGAQATFAEFDGLAGAGNSVSPIGPVSFSSDNAAVATVDPVSGACTAVAVGTANISGTDAGNGLTASDVLTVTDVAISATLSLKAN
jgi:hypothetical protein